MADIISQLSTDFSAFQTDFAAFVVNVQAALAKLAAGGLTQDQINTVTGIDTAVQALDATVKGISFPA